MDEATQESSKVRLEFNVRESEILAKKGVADVVILKPGFNDDRSIFYTKEAISNSYHLFEGARMFADHQTYDEPDVRSITKLVGVLHSVHVSEDGSMVGKAHIIDDNFQKKIFKAQEQNGLGVMGISIDAFAEGRADEMEGIQTRIVDRFLECLSVDFVTRPGAGGIIRTIESQKSKSGSVPNAKKEGENEMSDELKQALSDIGDLKETVRTLEAKYDADTKALQEEKKALEGRLQESEKAAFQSTLKEKLESVELPEPTKERLRSRFQESTDAKALEDAIKEESEYISRIQESLGTQRKFGPDARQLADNRNSTHQSPSNQAGGGSNDVIQLQEAFKMIGLGEESAKIAAGR